MTPRIQRLFDLLSQENLSPQERLGEVTIEVQGSGYRSVCEKLKADPRFGFEQLTDLCGVDYSTTA